VPEIIPDIETVGLETVNMPDMLPEKELPGSGVRLIVMEPEVGKLVEAPPTISLLCASIPLNAIVVPVCDADLKARETMKWVGVVQSGSRVPIAASF
jgi:hypothetical protein